MKGGGFRRLWLWLVLTCFIAFLVVVAILVRPWLRTPVDFKAIPNAAALTADLQKSIGYSAPSGGTLIWYQSDSAWDGTQDKEWIYFFRAGSTSVQALKASVAPTIAWMDWNDAGEGEAEMIVRDLRIRSAGLPVASSQTSQWDVKPGGVGELHTLQTDEGIVLYARWLWVH